MELTELKDKIVSAFAGTEEELSEVLSLIEEDKSIFPFNEYEHLICNLINKGGSGNTANIGSINHIDDIINGRGMFSKLGEKWFDDYWINFRKIKTTTANGDTSIISSLKEFVEYRKGDVNLIVSKRSKE